MYIIIKTKLTLRDLIQKDINKFKAVQVQMKVKRINNEYTKKIDFLTDLIVRKVNIEQYKVMIHKLDQIEEGEVKVQKKMVCKIICVNYVLQYTVLN